MATVADYIRTRAQALGLDPKAVLAVAAQEGLGGGIGDKGTSYGPFQLHIGGAYPGFAPQGDPQAAQAWAQSPAGIDYALRQIASVAKGMTGRSAIENIVRRFERPADPGTEVLKAVAAYGGSPSSTALSTGVPGTQAPGTQMPGALPSAQPDPLVKIPGLIQKGFPDLSRSLLNPEALTNQLLSAPLPAFKPPAMAMPSRRLLSATPSAAPPSATPGTGFSAGAPLLGSQQTSEGGEHPTLGLAGYPAHDYFADAGSETVAPISGKVVKLSGHDPSAGPTEGPHGPFGWSVYIQGDDGRLYYMTHMGTRDVRVGQQVKAGQQIGTVGDYSKYGTPSHIHMGVSAPGASL